MTGPLTGLAIWIGLSLSVSEPGSTPQSEDPGCVSKVPRKAVSPDEALEHAKRANELVIQGKAQDAILEYKTAMELWDHPRFVYNLGLVYRGLKMLLEAHECVEAAIKGGIEDP